MTDDSEKEKKALGIKQIVERLLKPVGRAATLADKQDARSFLRDFQEDSKLMQMLERQEKNKDKGPQK